MTTMPPSQNAEPAPLAEPSGFTVSGFFNFRYMITPVLVLGIYILVAVTITIIGLVTMFGTSAGSGVVPGLLIILIGNLMWRIYMEFVMLFFRINEGIQRIERNTRR